jgi:hypothetical protein
LTSVVFQVKSKKRKAFEKVDKTEVVELIELRSDRPVAPRDHFSDEVL